MNPHFDLHRDGGPLPPFVYARVEYVDRDQDDRLVIGLDAVSARSAEEVTSQLSPEGWATAWRAGFEGLGEARRLSERFDRLELIHLVVTLQPDEREFLCLLTSKQSWIPLHIGIGRVPATAYVALFAVGQHTNIEIGIAPDEATAALLNSAFSMNSWPQTQLGQIGGEFGQVDAGYWHAFDVGQGSANGFAGVGPVTLFHDLGCGAYANATTAPANAVVCHSFDAPIVLSHWDTDHWAGARRFAPTSDPQAFLRRVWIAPFDPTIGGKHATFACSILAAGGALKILPPVPGTSQWVNILNGRQLRLIKGNGTSRNGSGVAMELMDSGRRWLLTGDTDYRYLDPHLADEYVAMSVPHHGAGARRKSLPPRPVSGYARLVYSFGHDNTYGHPRQKCINDHVNRGWSHGGWSGKSPARAQNRATGCNTPGQQHLGGVAVGWTGAPPSQAAPACGNICTAYAAQS